MNTVLLFSYLASLFVFRTPTIRSEGWIPLGFSNEIRSTPRRIQVWGGNALDRDASALVAWRENSGRVFVRSDVCPHLGAVLSKSSRRLKNGCLQCSYHGVQVGPEAPIPVAREAFGKSVERDGIVWWTRDLKEDSDPGCRDLQECERRSDTTVSRWGMKVEASFGDCFRNSMDLHHAGWLHASTFGNRVKEPRGVTTTINRDEMRVEFQYVSNDAFRELTGNSTSNYHVFRKPSTTWNKVTSSNRENFVFIHVAMRPIDEKTMQWYVTSASNYIPAWLPSSVRVKGLEKITRRIAQKEDKVQLEKMASEQAKSEHAHVVTLALDTIYEEWSEFTSRFEPDLPASP